MCPQLSELRSAKNYLRVEYPGRPFRARTLGYKRAKHLIIVRAKIRRGGALVPMPRAGRNPKNLGRVRSRGISKEKIMAQRVARRYPSMNVMNYYPLTKDGKYAYYQVILYNPAKIGREKIPVRPSSWAYR